MTTTQGLDLTALEGLDPEQLEQLLRAATYDAENWFGGFAKIRTKEGTVKPVPAINSLQSKVLAHYRHCQAMGIPCLIMILKPRQKGASTIAQGVIYHHMRRHPELNGVIMGDVQATSDKVFEMFRRYAQLDLFPWGDGFSGLSKDENQTDNIKLPNASTFSKETAGSSNAGRSGTVQVLHLDEVAFFTQAAGKDPTTAVLGSFAKEYPVSLGFATSTAKGATGWFYTTWTGTNAWHKIFAAWFDFEDSYRAFKNDREKQEFIATMTDDEVQEQTLYGVNYEQLNWRRNCINTDYEGDVGKFRQEMPSNDEECFLLSSSPRFYLPSIKEGEASGKANDHRQRCNLIIQTPKSATLMPDPMGDIIMQEQPIVGCKYIGSLDTMTGEDQQTGATAKRDWHAAHIWRAGYTTPGGDYRPPALVAMHRSQVDTDVLAEIFASMSIYYGCCMTIPEVNGQAGIHIIKELQKYKVPMFRRRSHSASAKRKMTDEEILGAYGWNTDRLTKKWIVDAMVPLIRKGELDIRFSEVWSEFRTFIVNDKGGCEALAGKHDDHVIAAGMALYNIGAATEFKGKQTWSNDGWSEDGWRVVT